MNNIKKVSSLAAILKNSNIPEVKTLAEGFLALEASYNEIRHAYIKQTAKINMKKYKRLLERLSSHET